MYDFAKGKLIAFDQTLGNTGIAIIENKDQPKLIYTEVFKRIEPLKGFDSTIARAIELGNELHKWFMEPDHVHNVDAIIYEMPAVRGYRTESSLLAAFLINQAIDNIGLKIPIVSVSNTHAKKVIGLKTRSSKSEVKKAVEEILGLDKNNLPKIWNQHTSDAVMLGLTYLHDLRVKNER